MANQASSLFASGDVKGALAVLAQADPDFIKTPLAQQFEAEVVNTPERNQALAYTKEKGGLLAQSEFGSTPKQLADQKAKTEGMKPAKSKDLPAPVLNDLAELQNQTASLNRIKQLSDNIQNKFGFVSGNVEKAKKLLGQQDPDVQRFISLRGPFALALAAAMNKGRPTDPDREVIEKAIGDLQDNPAAVVASLDEIQGAINRSLGNKLSFYKSAGYDSGQIDSIAASMDMDLASVEKDVKDQQENQPPMSGKDFATLSEDQKKAALKSMSDGQKRQLLKQLNRLKQKQ